MSFRNARSLCFDAYSNTAPIIDLCLFNVLFLSRNGRFFNVDVPNGTGNAFDELKMIRFKVWIISILPVF